MTSEQRTCWLERFWCRLDNALRTRLLASGKKPPTSFQKWSSRVFNVILLGLLVLLIGWRWELHWDLGRLYAAYRAAGLPTNGEELNAFYTAVVDEQNAARIIMQAADLMQEYPDERRFEIRGFDGQPLRYHKLDQGYVLYSIGADQRDDGGRERPAHIKSSDTNSYDLTFIVER